MMLNYFESQGIGGLVVNRSCIVTPVSEIHWSMEVLKINTSCSALLWYVSITAQWEKQTFPTQTYEKESWKGRWKCDGYWTGREDIKWVYREEGNKPRSLSLSQEPEVLQPTDCLCGLLWTCSRRSTAFWCWQPQSCIQYYQQLHACDAFKVQNQATSLLMEGELLCLQKLELFFPWSAVMICHVMKGLC